MMILCKFVIFIALCKAVRMASDTIMENVYVDDSSLCDTGWKRFDKYCFKVHRVPKAWRTASAECKILGGNLASIHSKEQNDFLRDLSIETGVSYWLIGLHDHALDGIFVWDDGSDIDYTNWSSGEPDGDYFTGDCVAMSFHGNNFGAWYVRPCSLERAYLCQKKVSVATEDTNTEVDHSAFETMPYIAMEYTTVATALATEIDDTTITAYAMTSTGLERRTAPTEIIVTKENDYTYNFISVTNCIITLIIVIVIMVSIGGIFYYKRFCVEEHRLKV